MSNLITTKNLELTIPLKSIPDEKLNTLILTDFLTFVSNILSLTDETSADRLEIALPAIKQHCWSMGFAEIVKMFTMYVDGKLSVKPLPNYFDRILLGKIVASYKQYLKSDLSAIKIDESEYKALQDLEDCMSHWESFKRTGKLEQNAVWIYSYLYDFKKVQAFIDFADNIKFEQWERFRYFKKPTEEKIAETKHEILRIFFTGLVEKNLDLKPLI